MNTAEEDDIFLEMLEVFIQSILYLRDVYPAAIFRKRKMYNTAVFVSVYPKLNDYLKQVLASVKFLKTKNQLRRVELIISRLKNEPDIDLIEAYDEYLFNSGSTPVKSPTSTTHKLVKQTVIEKFVFEIDRPKTPDKNGNYRNKPSMLDDLNSKDKYLIEFEEELRRALIELEQMSRNLKGLDEDEERSFKINVETTQSAFVDLTSDSALQDFPWIMERGRGEVMQDEYFATPWDILPVVRTKGLSIEIHTNPV